jgi:hypothetical protein
MSEYYFEMGINVHLSDGCNLPDIISFNFRVYVCYIIKVLLMVTTDRYVHQDET